MYKFLSKGNGAVVINLEAAKTLSPLSIVAIFVSLAQSVSAIALIQTTGSVQLYLTYFVISFPVGIAISFFVILVKKHTVFYAPWEYKGVEEMREFKAPRPTDEGKLKDVMQSKFEMAGAENKKIVKEVMEELEESFLSINTTPLLGKEGIKWEVLYAHFETVQDLLDYIYWYIQKTVSARSYGKQWLLRDVDTGKRFEEMGSAYAKGLMGRDNRKLEEVDIRPGMHLEVISP